MSQFKELKNKHYSLIVPSHDVKACDHVSKVNKNLIQKYHEEWWCAWYVNWLLREKKTCNWWKADHQTTARAKTIEINFEKLLQFYYVNCEKNEYDNNRFSWIAHGIKPLRIHVMNIRWKFIDDYLNNIELNKNILDGFFHHFLKFFVFMFERQLPTAFEWLPSRVYREKTNSFLYALTPINLQLDCAHFMLNVHYAIIKSSIALLAHHCEVFWQITNIWAKNFMPYDGW